MEVRRRSGQGCKRAHASEQRRCGKAGNLTLPFPRAPVRRSPFMSQQKPIEYASATPEVQAIFDDIKATRGVPDVNNFWKFIAQHPPTLARTWDSIKDVMAPGALVPLFSRVRAQYPGIRLQIFESMSGYIGELLANGRLDLAMLFRDSETRGISVMPLFDEELYVLGGHRACPEIYEDAAQTTCTLARLANVPIVAPSGSNGLRLLIERSFAQANVELNIVADIDSLPTLIDIARSGDACSILPASALASRDPALRPPSRRLVSPELRRAASLCWSNALPVGSATVAVRRCIADLIRELQADGHWTGITLRPVEA